MILVRFTGGLGNQMFQYALGTNLAGKNRTELKIDTTFLLDRSQPHEIVTHRDLDIDVFNVKLLRATSSEIEHFNGTAYTHVPGKIYNKVVWELFRKKRLVVERQRSFQPEILLLPDDRCLVGAWQSENYFKEAESEIRKQYTFRQPLSGKAEELGKEIQNSNSLCLNVRRGDYVTSPVYSKVLGALPVEYFQKGVEYMRSGPAPERIFIFSDDIPWCKEHLKFPEQTTFVEHDLAGPKFSTYLQLMTLCRHFLIPNSSFGWWGAWLGSFTGKKIAAPLNWFKEPGHDSTDLIPKNWMRI